MPRSAEAWPAPLTIGAFAFRPCISEFPRGYKWSRQVEAALNPGPPNPGQRSGLPQGALLPTFVAAAAAATYSVRCIQ